jgi:SAM-dependent methyltransferase
MPDFKTRDAAQPAFWDERFDAGFMPWDARGVPPALTKFIADHGARLGRRVLVPGCGSAYEAALLDAAGFDVLAIDYSAAAVERARTILAPEVAARVLRQADFFAFDAAPFDWVYERAFLAALPPALWLRWSERLTELLTPDGLLAGLFFVDTTIPEPRRGPPFVSTRAELDTLLQDYRCEESVCVAPEESLPVFAGREQWMVWRRAGRAAA